MDGPRPRARLRGTAKVVIGLALIGWLLAKLDLHGVADAFGRARAAYLVVGLAGFFVQSAMQAVRLRVLVGHVIGRFGTALRLVLVGVFFSSFLPSNIGGDSYKVVYLRQRARTWGDALAFVLYDRAVGLGATLVGLLGYLAVAGVPAGQQGQVSWRVPHAAWVAALAAVAAAAVLVLAFGRRLRLGARGRQHAARMAAALREVPARSHAAIAALALATVAAQILRYQLFAVGFGVQLAPASWLYVIGLSNLFSLLPVSVGGLGVQEGVTIYALSAFAVPPPLAAAIALSNRAAIWLAGLTGGACFLAERRDRRGGADPAQPA